MMIRQNNHRALVPGASWSRASHVSDGELLVLCHLGLELRRLFFGKGGRGGVDRWTRGVEEQHVSGYYMLLLYIG